MIKLGQEVKDRVTGFKGIAIGRTHYLQGCDRVLVQPKVGKDEVTIPDATSFDEPDLVFVGPGIFPDLKPKSTKPPGGPRPSTSKRISERR